MGVGECLVHGSLRIVAIVGHRPRLEVSKRAMVNRWRQYLARLKALKSPDENVVDRGHTVLPGKALKGVPEGVIHYDEKISEYENVETDRKAYDLK